jgi:hypothetical protein
MLASLRQASRPDYCPNGQCPNGQAKLAEQRCKDLFQPQPCVHSLPCAYRQRMRGRLLGESVAREIHSPVQNGLVAGSSPARAHQASPCRLRVAQPSGNQSAKRGVRRSSDEARAKTDGRWGLRFATGRICRIPALTVRGNSESLSLWGLISVIHFWRDQYR